jgi:beta-galactosidase
MQLAVCYYPEHWPEHQWQSDARRMAELGISIVRIAEFSWAKIEPAPDVLDFAWLDRAIETLVQAGLKVVLGTPTAAVPKWLVDRYPDILPVGKDGRTKQFGSRRHSCFSSENYYRESQRIVTAMAQRYGQHPSVIAWQIDNEYGCHDTIRSYSAAALQRFRAWLQNKYQTIEALNNVWRTVFWSASYLSFGEIELPIATVTDVLPAHALDYRRFASDEVLRFNRMQVHVLREYAPGRRLVHNFMAFFTEFDVSAMMSDLDFASWDSYPLGHSEGLSAITDKEKSLFAQTGHPDVPAFHHDLYRGLGRGNFWVMEQQAGPVNWAAWNPAPHPGMVRLWTWQAFAHGAQVVSYFRWRQCPFGPEQMHSGLNTPDDQLDQGGREAAQVAQEIQALQTQDVLPKASLANDIAWGHEDAGTRPLAKVALVVDYLSFWQSDIQPQGADYNAMGTTFRWYSALRRLGLDVDICTASDALADYRLILVPAALHVSSQLLTQLEQAEQSGACILLGPRCGSKTEQLSIEEPLPPGPLRQMMPIRIHAVQSLRPGLEDVILWDGQRQSVMRWREHIEVSGHASVRATFADGTAALVQAKRIQYIGADLDGDGLRYLIDRAAKDAGLLTQDLGEGLRLSRCGHLRFAFNFGPQPVQIPVNPQTKFLLGQMTLSVGECAAWLSHDH